MIKYNCLLFVFLLSGCHMSKQHSAIDWTVASVLPSANNQAHIGVAAPVIGVVDNKLVIAGGANFPNGMPWDGGAKTYQKDLYIYDLDAKGNIQYAKTVAFDDSIAYASNISYHNKIYSVGGERNGQATADVFVYSLAGDKLERKALASLPFPLTNGALTIVEDKLYYAGGENAEKVSNQVFVLDLKKSELGWQEFFVLPKPVSHTVLTNDNAGNLFIIGGRMRNTNAASDIYKEVYKLNTSTKELSLLADLPEQLAAGTGAFYDGDIFVFGGDNGSTFNKVERLIADINLAEDATQKEKLVDQKNAMQRSHPGFPKRVWKMNLKENTWQATTEIVGESPVTTTAVLVDNMIIIPSGEVKAGVRSNQILTGKIN